MSNKIDSMTNTYLQITGRSAAGTRGTDGGTAQARPGEADTAARGDTVELTASARSLQALEARLADVGEVDQQRVDEVRARIESGRYTVDAQRIADKMIAIDRALPDDSQA